MKVVPAVTSAGLITGCELPPAKFAIGTGGEFNSIPIAMSAEAVTNVTAMTFVLFPGLASPVVAVLVALFVNDPLPGAVSTTKKLVPPPTDRFATMFVTSKPPGSVSTTTMFVAADGPKFVTDNVFV